jgi:hypothetical protein
MMLHAGFIQVKHLIGLFIELFF